MSAADGQDGALRRVDDGRELFDAEHAQVGNGESPALKFNFVFFFNYKFF
jgi:hypothetical protein